MPEIDLRALEEVLSSWEPDDPVDRHMHLFVNYPTIPFRREVGQHSAYEQEVERLRHEALVEILSDTRPDGMVRLIEGGEEPFTAGYAIATEKHDEVASEMLGWLGRDDTLGLAARMAGRDGGGIRRNWVAVTLTQISTLDAEARLHAYLSLPYRDEVLDLIPDETPEVQAGFWRGNPMLLLRSDRTEQIAKGLLDNGRPRSALSFLAHKVQSGTVSDGLLLRALRETGSGSEEPIVDAMIAYEAGVLLDTLERQGTDEALLASLEWMYFAILQHSRPPRALFRRLAATPFSSSNCSALCTGVHTRSLPRRSSTPRHTPRWRVSYSVLKEWRIPPGTARGRHGRRERAEYLDAPCPRAARRRGQDRHRRPVHRRAALRFARGLGRDLASRVGARPS